MSPLSLRSVWMITLLINAAVGLSAPPRGRGASCTRLYFGPAYGIYQLNRKHAVNPSARTSICAGFKREIRVDRGFHAYVLFGAEYLLHGLRFNSYYFAPDSVPLYDKNFAYAYALTIHELQAPVQFKYVFRRADNNLHSPYVAFGYQLRALVSSGLTIDRSGEFVKRDYPQMKFRHPLLVNPINSGVHIAAGWQRNELSRGRAGFYAEVSFRYGFSQYYFQVPYAPASLYMNSVHVVLSVGMRF